MLSFQAGANADDSLAPTPVLDDICADEVVSFLSCILITNLASCLGNCDGFSDLNYKSCDDIESACTTFHCCAACENAGREVGKCVSKLLLGCDTDCGIDSIDLPPGGCPVCGDGQVVTASEALFMFPGQPDIACGVLQTAGLTGLLPLEQCALLPDLIGVCGCMPANVLAAPTGAPIAAPTVAPSDAPVVVPSDAPVVAPTDAPVAPRTDAPVIVPTDAPVVVDRFPTFVPTDAPVNGFPVLMPSSDLSVDPTLAPDPASTPAPANDVPDPTSTPAADPTPAPVVAPTPTPTTDATSAPVSDSPVVAPTSAPTVSSGRRLSCMLSFVLLFW
jgi:hypothetical protein